MHAVLKYLGGLIFGLIDFNRLINLVDFILSIKNPEE